MGQIVSETKTSGWDNIWDGIASGLGGYAKGSAVKNMYSGERGFMNPGGLSSPAQVSPVAEAVKASASFVPRTSAAPAMASGQGTIPGQGMTSGHVTPAGSSGTASFGPMQGAASRTLSTGNTGGDPIWSLLSSGVSAAGQAGAQFLGTMFSSRRP